MIDMTPDENEPEGPVWLALLIPVLVVVGCVGAAILWG